MFPFQWLASLQDKLRTQQFRSSKIPRKQHRRFQTSFAQTSASRNVAELLEDRTLLTAFTVLNTDDSGAGSLREAIAQANANAGADSISFDAALAGQTIVLTNELEVTNDLTITGLGADRLTLDGDNNSRIFNIDDGSNVATITVEISGLTLTNGNSNETGPTPAGNGGAILSFEDLTVKNSTLRDNTARLGGGAIYASYASLTVENSLITGNTAMLHGGGGVKYHRSGGIGLIINESTFSHNSAMNGAGSGGAVNFYEGVASILNSTFTENAAVASGGAVYNNVGSMTIESSTLTKNVSGNNGGAIKNSNELFVYNSTLSQNNTRHFGAGIISSTNTTLEVVNSTIVLNYTRSASSQGGAIYGGNSKSFTIKNSIIAANTAANNVQITGLYTDTSNIISGSISGLIDPVLRDNGGPTNTHALLLGSAAINAGNNTATTNAGLATDQRGTGFTRIVDGTVDIGAVEFQLSYFLVDINSDLDDGDYSLGQLSLREAIKLANASSSVNTIIFDPSLAGQTIILNSELVISDDLTLTGLGAGQLTIDGNNTSRIFLIYDGDLEITRTVEISGLTLTNGNTIDKGGAILNYEDLIIKDSIVTGNTARLGGGGIYSSFVSLTIENSLITENTATFHGGGGIKYFKSGGSGLSIVDSIFSLNSAEGGSTGQGGAVYFYEGVASILNSTFTDNSSEGDGGAINNNISGSMTIDSSTFTENVSSTHGGAISNWNELFVHNSTLSNNTTHLWGAGIFSNSATALEIVNSTIVLNQATSPTSRSGAIYWTDSSPFKIANSIIAANTSANAHQIDGPYTTISNIVSDSLSGLIDPVLRDNGGPTKTHALVSGSAAINAGNNTEVTNAGLTTEQRGTGFSRIIDGTVDIGAVETQLSYLLVDTNSDLDDGDYSFGQLSLREAIKLANASSTVNTIIFDVSLSGQTILLNSELLISDDLTITGLGRDQLTLDANKTSRIFNIDDGNIATTIIVEITGLTLTNGETKSTGGAILSSEDLTVKDSTLRGNSARFGGGGIYSSLSSLAIVNSLITENSALFQGGGGVMYFRSGGTGLLVNESTFSLNSAVGSNTGQGGAIYFYEGIASILNSTFTENSGEINGGAIHNSYSGSMSVDSSTFTQNTASEQYGTGGAIYNENELFVTNSTLSGNRADFLGGGIYTFRHTTLEIVNSTIVANQATSSVSRGGGIYSTIPNSIQLTNSIVAGNTAVNHPQIDADYVGTNNIISSSIAGLIDPVLRDNGGPTKTHALLVGSAAINAGDNTAATNAGLTTDQRGTGFARIVDSTVDIGAVEASSLHFLVDTHSDLDDGDYSDGELSLREAIKLANASAGADTITFDVALAGQSIIIGTELRISDNLIISGLGAEQLTLDGNGDSRIFNVYSDNNGITAEIEISGLTLTNGYANSGGAIQSTENLTLLDMIITDNEADVQGGGLRNASAGILTVTNSQITENRALRGGGIYSQFSTLIITASTISNNESTKDGGGIHYTHSDLYGNSPSMIIDSTISDNIAGTNGGGIYNSRGHLQVNHSTFSRNAAILGGGLYSIGNADGGIVSVTDSTFSENTQVESGGGIYSENTILTVDGSTFSDNAATKFNYAGKGGGIFNLGGALTVTDTDFTRNSAVLKGGGIYNYSSDMFHVSRSTFSHNSAQQAAGVFN